MTQSQSYGPSWQGTLRDLANIVTMIRRSRAFGRLTLRNEEQLGVAHFYFHAGKLVHIIERHQIEGRPAQMIADNLIGAFEQYC